MQYIQAILDGNKQQQYKHLNDIIHLSKKIGVSSYKYQVDLKKLKKDLGIKTKKQNLKSLFNKVDTKKQVSQKPTYKNYRKKIYIKDIYARNNTIIIKFSRTIDDSVLKVSKWKDKYIYDIKAPLLKNTIKNIKIKGITKIVIGKYKPKVTRIVIQSKKKLDMTVNRVKNSMIIKIKNLYRKSNTKRLVYLNLKLLLIKKDLINHQK